MFTTYSGNKQPPLTLEVLEEAINLLPKPLKIPEKVYYFKSKFAPEGMFYKIPDCDGFQREIIVFNPISETVLFDLFGELKIRLLPCVTPFTWCAMYKQKNKPNEIYEEFWEGLCNACKNNE